MPEYTQPGMETVSQVLIEDVPRGLVLVRRPGIIHSELCVRGKRRTWKRLIGRSDIEGDVKVEDVYVRIPMEDQVRSRPIVDFELRTQVVQDENEDSQPRLDNAVTDEMLTGGEE